MFNHYKQAYNPLVNSQKTHNYLKKLNNEQ